MPITKKTSIEDVIHDFVNSDNPKFAGKSKEERIKMAKGAYYGMQKENIESFIGAITSNDKDSANAIFNNIILDKVAAKLEDFKVDIANKMFGFGEAKKIDDEQDDDDQDDEQNDDDDDQDDEQSDDDDQDVDDKDDKKKDKDVAITGKTGGKDSMEVDEAKYSAKAGAAGEDLGKPGKNFAKIANKAEKEYGSKEAGDRVAGAILAKIRAKHGIK